MPEPLSRFLRILLSTAISLIAAMMAMGALTPNTGGHVTHSAAGPLFLLGFLLPAFVVVVIAMSFLFFWLDRRALRSGITGLSVPLVLLLLFGSATVFFLPPFGALFLMLLFYWLLTGRVAGRNGWTLKGFGGTAWDEKLYLPVMAILLWPALAALAQAATSQVQDLIDPVDPALVPASLQSQKSAIPGLLHAARRFPDAQSCLVPGANAARHDDLLQMNWDLVDTTQEARLCVYWLLRAWGTLPDAEAWLLAQGLEVGDTFSSGNPYVDDDGKLRVDGRWSIRDHGPKFPTTGMVRRIMRAVPYQMTIHLTFSPDGQDLIDVNIAYNTL